MSRSAEREIPAAACKQHNLLCHAEQHFHIKQINLNIQVLLPTFLRKKSRRGQGRVALVAVRKRRNLSCRAPQSAKSPAAACKQHHLLCHAEQHFHIKQTNLNIQVLLPTFLERKVGEVKGEKPLSPFANGETSLAALRRARNPLKTSYKYSFLKTCKLSSGGRTGEYSKPHAPV